MRLSGFTLAIESYLVRKGMAAILNRIPGVRILGEVGSGPELIRYLGHHRTDFLIISEKLFNNNTEFFLSNTDLLGSTILLLENPSAGETRGVRSSIHISEDRDMIIGKIRTLLSERPPEPDQELLTQREKEILRLISMGLTNRQIAEKLFLSTHTVTTHRKNITGKLGIRSASGLTVYAIVNNIITIDDVSSEHE